MAQGTGRRAEGEERIAKRVVLRLKVRGTTVRRERRARGRQGEGAKGYRMNDERPSRVRRTWKSRGKDEGIDY